MICIVEQLLNGADVNSVVNQLLEASTSYSPPSRRKSRSEKATIDYLRKHSKPGDVFVVGPRRGFNPRARKAYYEVSKKLFGGKNNVHAAMYAGKGKMVDAIAGSKIAKVPLSTMIGRRNHISILRARTSSKAKRSAVRFANKQIGKAYSGRNLVAAGLKSLHPKMPTFGLLKQSKDQMICTAMIAKAYRNLDIVGAKKFNDVATPKDFRNSKDFRKVFSLERGSGSDKFQVVRPLKVRK